MKRKLAIMIVDDSEDIRSLLSVSLESAGYFTISSADGSHALRILRQGVRPDLIISDIEMPLVTGTELANAVSREFPAIPLMLMSGRVAIGKDELHALAVRSFVEKPFSTALIKRAIEECLAINGSLQRPA
jgi:CheY-like chemotaxis protein